METYEKRMETYEQPRFLDVFILWKPMESWVLHG